MNEMKWFLLHFDFSIISFGLLRNGHNVLFSTHNSKVSKCISIKLGGSLQCSYESVHPSVSKLMVVHMYLVLVFF